MQTITNMRALGSGLQVSAVGYGGMPISITGRPDEDTAIGVVHAALDAGMTLIDTANVYCLDDDDLGHNERLIAKALRQWGGNASGITVATKGGLRRPRGEWTRDASPAELRRACEASLIALGVECIDLYQLHAPDEKVPLADSVGTLADLKGEGKIRRIGLSNVSVAEIDVARGVTEITSVQNRLSPFFREAIETGVVAHTAAHGIAFLAYSPVGGGRLNKKLPGHPALAPIAAAHGISEHSVVLAWVLAVSPNVIIIPGARSVRNVLGSAEAAGLELSQEEIDSITAAEFSIA